MIRYQFKAFNLAAILFHNNTKFMQCHRVLNKSGSRRLTAGSRLLTIWGLLPGVLGHAAHKIYLKGSCSGMPF